LASSKWSKILSWEKKKKSFRKRKGKRKIKGIGERIWWEGGNMTRGSYEVSKEGGWTLLRSLEKRSVHDQM
jgi:hypothetical protein